MSTEPGITGSIMNALQHWRGTSAPASHCLRTYTGVLTEEPFMAYQPNPNDPYRAGTHAVKVQVLGLPK